MRFLVAPNAFKETLTAQEAAREISSLILEAYPKAEVLQQPIADGGDGTCELLIDSLGFEKIYHPTLNPIGRPILGFYGWDKETKRAFLDVSTASGIGLLSSDQKIPDLTSTYGTGILIQSAIQRGAKEILLGLGGSATVDLGVGILSALGVFFLDKNGREIPAFSPGYLKRISHVQLSPQIPKVRFTLLCDVKNPLLGELGAVKVFGPQKGIQVEKLLDFEQQIQRVHELLIKKKKSSWSDQPGFGAAGGIAAGLDCFFPTQIKFGAEYFFELVGIKESVEKADWIITGEGKYDSQSNQGKGCFELLKLTKASNKKIVLITSGKEALQEGFDRVLELPPLDFTKSDFRLKALSNFQKVIQGSLKGNIFETNGP
ncbi:glycerate kinase [Algoriphagus mannitolivorans]|uniref:glycerate kinase n=1 Tax=Algoriphagus mannitolivorans TaxID=226504 RepID=UPI0004126775|nr:glycerate kinase [Algoriphagus mannitolivorans]